MASRKAPLKPCVVCGERKRASSKVYLCRRCAKSLDQQADMPQALAGLAQHGV